MSNQKNPQQSSFPLISLPVNTFHPYSHETEQKHNFAPLQENINLQYYQEYKKLYFTAYCISLQFKKINKAKEQLCIKLNKLEKKVQDETKNDSQQIQSDKQKRFRRKADQIERRFFCQAERCGRNYGSEGSLQQHIKLKHPEMYRQSYHSQFSESSSL